MADTWKIRLKRKLDEDGRSLRAVSLAAKLGPNYVQQLFKDDKDPGFEKVTAVLNVLGRSAMLYVQTGQEITEQEAAFQEVFGSLSPEMRDEVIRFLRMMQAQSQTQSPALSAHESK